MRTIAFFPLTFIAGVEGFGWFVGYIAAIFMILELRRVSRRWAPVRVNLACSLTPIDHELEPAQF